MRILRYKGVPCPYSYDIFVLDALAAHRARFVGVLVSYMERCAHRARNVFTHTFGDVGQIIYGLYAPPVYLNGLVYRYDSRTGRFVPSIL